MKVRGFSGVIYVFVVVGLSACNGVNFSGGGSGGGAGGAAAGTNPGMTSTTPPMDTGGNGTNPPAIPACTLTNSTTVLTALPSNVTAAQLQAICPAAGQDTECGTLIIVTDTGSSIYYSGQGPYDGNDDTLVGVINLSTTTALNSLNLSSNVDIMGFDNDGVDTFLQKAMNGAFAGDQQDTTTYGGPNTYFTNISVDNTSGTANFSTPIAANGGTTYFSLENKLNATATCLKITPQ